MTQRGETASPDQWRKAVASVLAKSRRVDPLTLGAAPEDLLATHTVDGLDIAALYTSADELPEPPLPGAFPYVRGRDANRDVSRGWLVNEYVAAPDAKTANERILDALNNGAGAVTLHVGAGRVPASGVGRALEGVLVDLAPISLYAGESALDASVQILNVIGSLGQSPMSICLGVSPLTSEFSGRPDVSFVSALEIASRAKERFDTVRAILVDGLAFHNAGAGDAEEIGASIAAGLAYVRALTEVGFDVDAAFRQIEFSFAATDDQFATIAKFRAARQVWARVCDVAGVPELGGVVQRAVTSPAMMTQRDPWVNLLRTTVASFAAGVGGADIVTTLPFDSALAPGALGLPEGFSARLARNLQLILLEESNLGRVMDPGAGSWFLEKLTSDIAEQAWAFFQETEKIGGYQAAFRDGLITRRIAETKAKRDEAIAKRKIPITGVSEFPNLSEEPLAPLTGSKVSRYAQQFESLRDRSDAYLAANGARPKVFLAPLGPVAEHNTRGTWITNLLAAGGIAVDNPGVTTVEGLRHAATASRAPIAVIVGTDARYAECVEKAVAGLRAAGVKEVLLAGPESAVAEIPEKKRPDGYVTAKINAAAELDRLLTVLGAGANA
ncbi:MAG: methylmalonyl-CoA mutase family protein [Nocardiaceae bacterium]|nr:methylmalonyl-CoA mutase family protein [Nocardiaceae bacterium]